MRHPATGILVFLALLPSACATVTPMDRPDDPVVVVVGHAPALPAVPEPPPPPPPPPPEPPPKAVVRATAIELREPVPFAETELTAEAAPVLDAVAELLQNNPWILKLSVEVHADAAGKRRTQRKLARARAATIQAYLVERGIDAERIDTAGHVTPEPERALELLIVAGQPPEPPDVSEAPVEAEEVEG